MIRRILIGAVIIFSIAADAQQNSAKMNSLHQWSDEKDDP